MDINGEEFRTCLEQKTQVDNMVSMLRQMGCNAPHYELLIRILDSVCFTDNDFKEMIDHLVATSDIRYELQGILEEIEEKHRKIGKENDEYYYKNAHNSCGSFYGGSFY